jgi:hypothetical protein
LANRRKGESVLVATALLCILVLPSMIFFFRTPFTCWAAGGAADSSGRAIDVYTNKEPFSGQGPDQESDAFEPQEEVILYALVTYNGDPVPGKIVAYNIQGPVNSVENLTLSLSAVTNDAGVASVSFVMPWPDPRPQVTIFGTWVVAASVDIAGVIVTDVLSFRVGWLVELLYVRTADLSNVLKSTFSKGERMGFRLGVENIALTEKTATFVVTASDELNFSFGVLKLENQVVPPGAVEYFLRDLFVPTTAFVGKGSAVANALKPPDGIASVAWCPSVNTTFSIGSQVVVHDVAVVQVTPSVSEALPGQTVNVTVVVKNLGDVSERFNASAYANAMPVGTIGVEGLAAGAEAALVFSWFTNEVPLGDYRIKGIAEPVPGETNVDNNVLVDGTVKITSVIPSPPVSCNPLLLALLFILIVLIGALLVAALLVFLFCRRRRKNEEEEPERVMGPVAVLPLTAVKKQQRQRATEQAAILPSAIAKKCKVCGKDFPAVYTFCPHCMSFHGKDF